MATSTPIDSEMALLVRLSGKATAPQTKTLRSGTSMTKASPCRHTKLSNLLKREVSMACPRDLYNDQDDIVQTVLIRLLGKLDKFEHQIGQWLELHQPDRSSKFPEECLREIEIFGDRKACKQLHRSMEECLSIVEQIEQRERLDRSTRGLRKCFTKFQKLGGDRIFAKYYRRKNIHWAILDALKRNRIRPEDQIEDGQDGSQKLPDVQPPCVEHQVVIKQAINDCLAQMPEHYREATILTLQGNTVPQIAELLALNIRQAESRVQRGKKRLRECLTRQGVTPWNPI